MVPSSKKTTINPKDNTRDKRLKNVAENMSTKQLNDLYNYNQQKLARDKSNLNKLIKKTRNISKNSVSGHGERESKTYSSVLQKRKSKDQNSQRGLAIGSPEEINEKMKSDKTNKSSLTSSTTTHTNNGKKKRGSGKSIKKRKTSCFGSTYLRKQSSLKSKAVKTNAIKYDNLRPSNYKASNQSNVSVHQSHFHDPFEFEQDQFDERNQTIDYENIGTEEDRFRSINTSGVSFRNRHSLAGNTTANKSLKLIKKKSGSKVKHKIPNLKIKKSTIHDISYDPSRMSATFDNNSSMLREAISGRRENKSNSKKRLTKIKSSSMLKFPQKEKTMFDHRKSSLGSISTSKLCHLPKDFKDPRTLKNNEKQENMSTRLRRSIYGKSKYGCKSGSLSTKNRSKVSVGVSLTNLEKPKVYKKKLNDFRSSSTYKTKKIASTKQPSKPADVKNETIPENEGSSFKTSKISNHK